MCRLRVDESRVREVVLIREDRACPQCGARMHIRCTRKRSIHTFSGPLRLIVKLVQCCHEQCDLTTTFAPEQEAEYAMPRWGIGWDVFCWIGQRRFSRHWSVPQIRLELADSYDIALSEDAIEDHIASYQNMVATRHQDLQTMQEVYREANDVVLTIDGLQPEKGHETLYVVREVTRNRVWFAEPLLSSATDEIRKLFVRAKQLAESLNLNVVLWISDKQDAFLKCVNEKFLGVPHRYCENHFFRDFAKPVLEIEARQVDPSDTTRRSTDRDKASVLAGASGQAVLDYCSVVRGVLNDNHGGPYHPSGMRMLEALGDVQESLEHIASSGKLDPATELLQRLKGFLDRGMADQQVSFSRVQQYTEQVRQVMDLLTDPNEPLWAERETEFVAKMKAFQNHADDAVFSHFAKIMKSFQVGLFAGPKLTSYPRDNLDLERWFRSPKSHERRIHGHCHAGIRIVRDGPTLVPTLDSHSSHPGVFHREDLFAFRTASAPPSQLSSQQRHGIMRKSRSKKNESLCSKN